MSEFREQNMNYYLFVSMNMTNKLLRCLDFTAKIIFIAVLLVLNIQAQVQDEELDSNPVISKIENQLNSVGLGRYMEGTPVNTPVPALEGWDHEKLSVYEYTQPDKINGTLKAQVIMYNADVHRIANWIYYALDDSKKDKSDTNIKTIINVINNNSGFQFPVRGIVYEDIYDKNCNCALYDECKKKHLCKDCSKDKIQESYIFFDGLTVKHKDITLTICTYDKMPIRILEGQNKELLSMTSNDIKSVGNYARIASTEFSQFQKFMKLRHPQEAKKLDGLKKFTPEIVRTQYILAMHHNRNNLISAWVYSNIKK